METGIGGVKHMRKVSVVVAVVAVFLLGACQSEPEVVYRDRPVVIPAPVPAGQSYQDQQDAALLDCLQKMNDNITFNDPPFGC